MFDSLVHDSCVKEARLSPPPVTGRTVAHHVRIISCRGRLERKEMASFLFTAAFVQQLHDVIGLRSFLYRFEVLIVPTLCSIVDCRHLFVQR